jgi:hypothetical protein
MTQSNNIMSHYIPLGGIVVILSMAFWLGQKIENLETLNKNITSYMETYSAERFVNLERDILDNRNAIITVKDDIKSIKLTLDRWQLSE